MYGRKATLAAILVLALIALSGLIVAYKAYTSMSGVSESIQEISRQVKSIGEDLSIIQSEISGLNSSFSSLRGELSLFRENVNKNISLIANRLESASFPLQVRDAMHRIVVVQARPEKIVSIAPSVTEILFSIGAGDLVVGVDDYSNYPPVINEMVADGKIVRVGGFSTIDIEKVLSLKPDLVVGTTGVQFRPLYRLSQMGITTLSLSTSTLGDIYSSILLLGKITGHMKEASSLVGKLRDNITSLYLRLARIEKKPTVLYVVWVNPFYVAGGGSWFNDVIELSGGVNSLSNTSTEWPSISWEELLKLNPDVILLSENAGGFGDAERALQWFSAQPGGKNLAAVIKERVYMFHGSLNDIASRPGPRVYILQEVMALILHPSVFNTTVESIPHDLYLSNLTSILAG